MQNDWGDVSRRRWHLNTGLRQPLRGGKSLVICLNVCSICQPQIPRQIHNPDRHQNVTWRCLGACFHLQIFHINKFSNSFILSSLSALLDVTHSCHKRSDTSSTTTDKRYRLRRSAHQNVLGERCCFYTPTNLKLYGFKQSKQNLTYHPSGYNGRHQEHINLTRIIL